MTTSGHTYVYACALYLALPQSGASWPAQKYRLVYVLRLRNQVESTVISSGFNCTIHDSSTSSSCFKGLFTLYELQKTRKLPRCQIIISIVDRRISNISHVSGSALSICRVFHHQVLGSRWIDKITMSMPY